MSLNNMALRNGFWKKMRIDMCHMMVDNKKASRDNLTL